MRWRKQHIIAAVAALLWGGGVAAQQPRLVVGIVIDQMRQDYLTRFWDYYGEGGFKKLVSEGYHFDNAQYDYVPTYTGPGHAHIFSGAMPSVDGIIGNEWYDRDEGKVVYCAEDNTVATVGSPSKAGLMSPRRLITTSLGDEMKITSNGMSKVIGVSLKDRGAILSTGHLADAAYWHDGYTGNFITSTYYMKDLPDWVKRFNREEKAEDYMRQDWNTLLPLDNYKKFCDPDDNAFEGAFKGEGKPVFPHRIPKLRENYTGDLIRSIPGGNTFTVDFAEQVIEHEDLGRDEYPDLLVVSFSSTDYVGHQFGPRSVELADTYLRLDRDLARLITFLEKRLGNNGFVLVLSADHAASDNPLWLKAKGLPGGNFIINTDSLQSLCRTAFGAELILAFENLQVYFDKEKIQRLGLTTTDVAKKLMPYIAGLEGVSRVIPVEDILRYDGKDPIMERVQNGYNPHRSGDLQIMLDPGWVNMTWQTTGTTHGSPYPYDSRVPMLWYGAGVKAGHSVNRVSVADIAPTLAMMLQVNLPNGALSGKPLNDWLSKGE